MDNPGLVGTDGNANDEVRNLTDEVNQLRSALMETRLRLQVTEEVETRLGNRTACSLPLPRRVDKFRGRPSKASDPTISEWVADMRAHLGSYKGSKEEKAAFILQHLGGDARLDITSQTDIVGDPDRILSTLSKTFGDPDHGDTHRLQQRFFTYRQQPEQDLLACSLELMRVFEKLVELQPSWGHDRQATLKGRFAEAVRDEALQRELRRLNLEVPTLSYVELRERATQWMGTGSQRNRRLAVQEHHVEDPVVKAVKEQGDRFAEVMHEQQKQMAELMNIIVQQKLPTGRGRGYITRPPGDQRRIGAAPRRCWACNSADHVMRDCPTRKKEAQAAPPPN
jgi:hypothetical protein